MAINMKYINRPFSLISRMLILVTLLIPLVIQGQSREKISITVNEVRLENVLRILSEKSGMKFISDPAIRTNRITLDLKDVAPLEALSIMTELYDLGFQQLGASGKYLVTFKDDIAIPTKISSYSCQFSEAAEMAESVQPFLTADIGKVYGDERTNMVIIQDTPAKVSEILELMSRLDTHTQQVKIKSAIIEVSVSGDHERGIQWFSDYEGPDNEKGVFGTDFGLRGQSLEGPLVEPVLPNISAGFGVGIIASNIDVVLGLLSASNDINLLSTPHLMVLDNKDADIEVGDQIPYPKLNEFGQVSYEFKNATVKLSLRVHVNNDSTVTIRLEPQANVQQGFTPDGIPIVATRRASTEVIVKNGQTVILGGLMQESDVVSTQRVPLLGSIPIIGELFKYTQTSRKKTELLVMLTPEIVDVYNINIKKQDIQNIPEEFIPSIK
jgi:type IV pilus assembly protein PilQ